MNAALFPEFVSAMLDAEPMLPDAFPRDAQVHERFGVHRNTSRIGLTDTLRTAYPAVVNAVGDTYFEALAAEFIRAMPPRSPVMQEYSPALPEFIEGFPPLSAWPWLGDVGRIDWARREAHHAEDAVALTARQLQALSIDTLMNSLPRLHPSLRMIESPHPALSLWFYQQSGGAMSTEIRWHAESVQVWRIGFEVKQRRLTTGEAVLRHELAGGRSFGDALHRTTERESHFDATSAITSLIVDGLIVALEH